MTQGQAYITFAVVAPNQPTREFIERWFKECKEPIWGWLSHCLDTLEGNDAENIIFRRHLEDAWSSARDANEWLRAAYGLYLDQTVECNGRQESDGFAYSLVCYTTCADKTEVNLHLPVYTDVHVHLPVDSHDDPFSLRGYNGDAGSGYISDDEEE